MKYSDSGTNITVLHYNVQLLQSITLKMYLWHKQRLIEQLVSFYCFAIDVQDRYI